MPDRIESYKLVCEGGLNSTENHLNLSENSPGSATRLVNYEPSLFGGYRRIEGYSEFDPDYPEVDDETGSAEGPVLCVAVFRGNILGLSQVIAARKDTGENSYSFYKHTFGLGWEILPTPTTRLLEQGTNVVKRVRHVQFDFGAGNSIAFVDGLNKPLVFDGTDFFELLVGGSGSSNNPGGSQVLVAPAIVEVFENHLFLSGDRVNPSVVAHSAPNNAINFSVGDGAGQLSIGNPVVQFKPFRDNLFVFGDNSIKRITADVVSGFVLEQVTANVGCIARDSVQEIGGDLIFLAPDGLRPVAGTSRIGDVELETISKPIQGRLLDLIKNQDLDALSAVAVRSKSQVRYFFSDEDTAPTNAIGIIGALTNDNGQLSWEFGNLLGIRASCTASEYIGREEFILHGDFNGNVYRQEQGQSFDGRDIVSVYSTPYLDYGDPTIRKIPHKINTFIRAEGPFTLNLSLQYDWGDQDTARPSAYDQSSAGAPTVYGGRNITYSGNNVTYGGNTRPVMVTDLQGSGFSVRATFVTSEQSQPFTIQSLVFEFAVAGRR